MENIKVFVRVRPLTDAEKSSNVRKIVQVPSKTQLLVNKVGDEFASGFTFAEVFDEEAKQDEVFDAMLRPIVDDVLQGYNCTLFAYGSSGSGKTHTMIGDRDRLAGMGPRTIEEIFSRVNGMNVEYTVRISYLEIFNEELIDLFATADNGVALKIYENAKGQVQVNGLREIVATSATEASEALHRGHARMKNGTKSLRSHSIITIMVYIKEKPKRRSFDSNFDVLKFSKLSLVELAGSESAYKSGSDQSARLKVNQSLVSFNRVVQALIGKSAHIPYRDSKMMRILHESLGGNSKTSFIATIAPGHNATEETLSTLEYVSRVKNICNRPQINERLSKTVLLEVIATQIDRLKRDIEANKTKTGRYLTEESYSDSMNQLNKSIHHVQKSKSELDMLTEEYAKIQGLFSDVSSNLQQHERKIENILASVAMMRRHMDELNDKIDATVDQIGRMSHTEGELLHQASGLTVVVDEAGKETQQLHASIDRRTEYEKNLERTCKRFVSNVKGQLDEMVQFIRLNATMVDNMLSSYAGKYDQFHQVVMMALGSYIQNINVFLKTGAHSERSAMLNKAVEMARDVHSTIDTSNYAPIPAATNFDAIARIYKEQMAIFASAQQDIQKMIALGREATDKFTSTMKSKVLSFQENMRALIGLVNIIDEANAANQQINHKLLKMYEQIYSEVKSVCTVDLPEKLKPVFVACEKEMQHSTDDCTAELAKHKLEREKAAEGCRFEFDVNANRRIVADLHTVMQEGQHVEDTFAEEVFKTHATTQSQSLQEIDAIKDDLHQKRSLLTDNDRIEQLKQNFEKKSNAASIQNIQGVDLMNSICSSAEHFKENTAECMRQCGNDLREFKESGFHVYVPSGGTPMKRDYKKNVRLVATEPHELIKEEIRKKIDEGMGLDCSIVNR